MKKLPQAMFVVGDKTVNCPKTAAAIAKKSGGNVKFLIAGKKFKKQAEAMEALADATESFVSTFADPIVCEKTGTITVAGQKACCPDTATKTSKSLKVAMSKVKMSYVVGDKRCGCPNKAEQIAKDTGKATEFVVGEVKTPCNIMARIHLARAKYKAAVESLVQTDVKPASTDS